MNIFLLGLNHKTAPIEIREKFYLQPLERKLILSELKNDPRVVEAFVLSTCNRTEIYAHMIDDQPQVLLNMLCSVKKLNEGMAFAQYFYIKRDQDAIRHLFEVACGLDSLMVGEKQILGQLKESAEIARQSGALSRTFNILLNICMNAGKTAQAKTEIGIGGTSVSWAAVAVAQKILGSLEHKSILILGAGKMSQLTAGQLLKKAVPNIFVINRTFEKAQSLAKQVDGKAVQIWDLKNILTKVDACICSAGAPHFLIDPDLALAVADMRENKPLLLVDISTPRNIDPKVSSIKNIQLVSIDDLQCVIDDNMISRQSAVKEVKQIIEGKILFFNNNVVKRKHPDSIVYVS